MAARKRIGCAFAGVALALGLAASALAGKLDLITLGIELGRVLAAEQPCGLSYDHAAISAFIAKRVPADDLSFMSHVQTGIGATEFKLSDMTASQKTALCTQVKRNAKSFGFMK